MKNNSSILIPDGDGGLAIKVLRCLGQVPDLKISVFSNKPWVPLRFSRYCANFYSADTHEYDRKRLDAILAAARDSQAGMILPADQPTIRLLSSHRQEVEALVSLPPIPTPDMMDIVADKWPFSEVLRSENIPYPKTVLLQDEYLQGGELAEFEYPALAKPRVGAGGTGIEFFNTEAEVRNFLKDSNNQGKYILQEFIRGYDIGCSVLCKDGDVLAYTIQKGVIPGRKRFEPPAGIDFIHQEMVLENVQKLMRALNWSGVANIDIRYDEKENLPKILEMNPRYWASLLGSLAAGINFPYLAYQSGMNIEFPRPDYQTIRFVYTEQVYGLLVKKYLAGDRKISSVRNTSVRYTLKDPIPELYQYSSEALEKVFQKRKG